MLSYSLYGMPERLLPDRPARQMCAQRIDSLDRQRLPVAAEFLRHALRSDKSRFVHALRFQRSAFGENAVDAMSRRIFDLDVQIQSAAAFAVFPFRSARRWRPRDWSESCSTDRSS